VADRGVGHVMAGFPGALYPEHSGAGTPPARPPMAQPARLAHPVTVESPTACEEVVNDRR
jgi:hypothetical protein